jgi:hypothetical protein
VLFLPDIQGHYIHCAVIILLYIDYIQGQPARKVSDVAISKE